jgi:beta-ketodecanoyl-[acyl-carrier-protein] synthase
VGEGGTINGGSGSVGNTRRRMDVVITGTGLAHPPHAVSNAELVASLTAATERWNLEHAAEIERGELAARATPDGEFIVKASGIHRRYVIDKVGVLDPDRMRPHLERRSEDQLGIQAEMALPAIEQALAQAGRRPDEVDAVIVGCSNLQRAYPAVSIEIQNALGAGGWAYDMNVACSSATFSMQAAADALRAGSARCVVVVNPEITSGHNNFELRDFHFIFGDACTAMVLERSDDAIAAEQWTVLGTKLATQFSNNIRNDFGFLNSSEDGERDPHELIFRQRGQQVFKEVCPMVAAHIRDHLSAVGLDAEGVRRFWLHQANLKMNQLIAKGVLGRVPTDDEAPVVLDEFANTSSAGSVIAFHRHRADLASDDVGVICSFGAGYSVGSVVVRKR